MKHRIYLSDSMIGGIEPGWYCGWTSGTNAYMYGRTKVKEKALEFDPADAFRICQDMRSRGYKARCEPPVTITL